ncbi:MAG: InlB B-repeat-containing protein [Roseburia sp.]
MKYKRRWILFLFVLFLWGMGNCLSVEAANTSMKVPTDPGALISVGSVPYNCVSKTWSQWVDYFSANGYSYSHCYYEVEVSGADRISKVSDVCWCAFTKGGKLYWSPMVVNGNGTYAVTFNHWNYIGTSTNPGGPGGSYTGSGAYWYFTNGNGVVYQDNWIYVPISMNNIQRLGYFYVDGSGHMLTGWNQDTAGNWYYFKIDHVSNEDGASVKTGVSSDMNCSTVCWTEVKKSTGSGSYGLYRYDGVDVRTNFYIMDTSGNYPVSYSHSTTRHMTAAQVPPLNANSSVSYDSATAAAYYTATGFYHDTSRGTCGKKQSVYLANQDWQSISLSAFQCYIGRRQYSQTVYYRKMKQGVWQLVEADTRCLQAYYGSSVSLGNWTRTYTGYKQERILKNGTAFSGNQYTVSGNNQFYFDYRPIQYTVSYHGNGAEKGSMSDSVYTYDSTALLAANGYSRSNYRFEGWALSPEGAVVYPDQATVHNWTATDGKQISLYAVWQQIMATVTVRVYQMDVTGSDYLLQCEKDMTSGLGDRIILSELAEKEAAEGFCFSYGTVDGIRTPQMTVAAEKGTVISLYFDRNRYAVTVNAPLGLQQTQGAGVYYYGAKVSVSAELADGYSFLGWKNTGIIDSSDLSFVFSMPASPVTVTGETRAHTYEIVFDGNGATEGDMSDSNIQAVYGENYTLPVNGYRRVTEQGESVFCGWSTDSGAGYAQCEYTDGQTVSNLTSSDGATVTLYAIWDDLPGIVAEDLYYTLEEAQSGAITYEELMAQASAYDREQITDFGILDYAMEDFQNFSHGGSLTVTYQVVDTCANHTRKQIRVYLVDTTARPVELQEPQLRFISSRYLDTLAEDSKWKTDSRCVSLLSRALEGTDSFCSYEFSVGDEG